MDDHNYIPYEGYTFTIDDGVVFTNLINVSNTEEREWEEDCYAGFDPSLGDNWRHCYSILSTIENALVKIKYVTFCGSLNSKKYYYMIEKSESVDSLFSMQII